MSKAPKPSVHHVDYDVDLPGGLRVSTVKLPINHQRGDGPDLWYETMVFPKNSYHDLAMDRYTTEEEAIAGHAVMVARVISGDIADSQTDDERERYSPEGVGMMLAEIAARLS